MTVLCVKQSQKTDSSCLNWHCQSACLKHCSNSFRFKGNPHGTRLDPKPAKLTSNWRSEQSSSVGQVCVGCTVCRALHATLHGTYFGMCILDCLNPSSWDFVLSYSLVISKFGSKKYHSDSNSEITPR